MKVSQDTINSSEDRTEVLQEEEATSIHLCLKERKFLYVNSTQNITTKTTPTLPTKPILDQEQLFNFYRIEPMPVFNNGKAYIPQLDAHHMAISKSGSNYITVSRDEYTQCMYNKQKCLISSLITPVTEDVHCVLSTYILNEMKCPLVESTAKIAPVLHINGNTTIYSVPAPTPVYIKCKDPKHPTKFRDETITLKGSGEISFQQGCSITLPKGQTFKIPTGVGAGTE